MNEINKKIIYTKFKENVDYLSEVLPPIPDFPVRNACAHVYGCFKHVWGVESIDEIPDDYLGRVLEVMDVVISRATDPDFSYDEIPKERWKRPLSDLFV